MLYHSAIVATTIITDGDGGPPIPRTTSEMHRWQELGSSIRAWWVTSTIAQVFPFILAIIPQAVLGVIGVYQIFIHYNSLQGSAEFYRRVSFVYK